MTVFKLKEQLFDIIDGLKKRIRARKYKSSPVRRVKIPKSDNDPVGFLYFSLCLEVTDSAYSVLGPVPVLISFSR